MKGFLVTLITIFLTGCATAYQNESYTGGFSTIQLDTNVFKVSFRGNGFTKADRATDFSMLRSAELTLQNGYEYFVIIDGQSYTKINSYTTPTNSVTNINSNTSGTAYTQGNNVAYAGNTTATATTTTTGGQTILFASPTSTNTIICFVKKPEGFSYNAKFVEKSIKDKYGLK